MHPQLQFIMIFLFVTNVTTMPNHRSHLQATTTELSSNNSATITQFDDYDENVSAQYHRNETNKSKLNTTADTLKFLEKFIQTYIDAYFEEKITHSNSNHTKLSAYGKTSMQDIVDDMADYPNDDSGVTTLNLQSGQNQTNPINMSITSATLKQQDDRRHRDREMRKIAIRQQILETVGRSDGSHLNGSKPTLSTSKLTVPDLILSQIGNGNPGRKILSNPEKYQSFVPRCEIPKHTDQAMWTDSSYMNLFFNINISNHKDGLKVYIAKATLRLYKISPENISQVDGQVNKEASGGSSSQTDLNFVDKEDRQIRVSIYWYTRTLRKHRVKRRLSDSKMISIYDPRHGNAGEFIEFNIRPAARSWLNTGRNLGLGVVVEDQECNILQANKYFKNIDCHNNNQASQIFAYPRPIFEQIFVNRQSISNIVEKSHNRTHHEPGEQYKQEPHRTSAIRFGEPINTDNYNSVFFLPTINLCTVDIPAHLDKLKMDEIKRTQCDFDLKNIFVDNITESVQNDSPTDSSPVTTTTHKTRHRHPAVSDPRDVDMQNKKVIFTHEELESLLRKNVLSATTEQTFNNR